jgi:hypothetical protein
MQIPTTPTTEDRNREKKNLEEKITALKSAKDNAERETKISVECADSIRETIKVLNQTVIDIMTVIPEVSHETHQFITHCNTVIRDCSAKIDGMVSLVVLLEKSAKESTEALEKARIDAKIVHVKVVEETQLMQTQRADLDIYKARIESYYAKYLPKEKIII